MRTVTVEQRRARIGVRHHLARPAADVTTVAGDLVGLHSSDPATVYLSAWARVDGFVVEDLEDALYEGRSLVRVLGMRRTMFVTPVDVAAVMDAACAKALAPAERRRLVKLVEEQGLAADGAAWVADVERRTLEALAARGSATAQEVARDVPELREKLSYGEGKRWAGTMGVSTRILFLLATEGRVVRGRPLGTWLSTQYRWAPTDRWLGAPLAEHDDREASADLVRRWLGAFGPGTAKDVRWWTGWTKTRTLAALRDAAADEVDLDGTPGYDAPDVRDDGDPGRWVALLPALDATVMAWKDRDWYLGDHAQRLFDRNGNAGPTAWVDGRVVGGWAQREDGEIRVETLEDVGTEAADALSAEAERLAAWLGDTRFVPRFRTPLERDLSR